MGVEVGQDCVENVFCFFHWFDWLSIDYKWNLLVSWKIKILDRFDDGFVKIERNGILTWLAVSKLAILSGSNFLASTL